MLESVDLMRAGTAPRIVQDHAKASYESWCKREHAEIDWSKPAGEVYNLIRGTNPQPGAWTTFDGKTLQMYDSAQIYDSAKAAGGGGAPGEVTGLSGEGFTVAAGGGEILVKRVRPQGEGKMGAAEFAANAGLAKGARLGSSA